MQNEEGGEDRNRTTEYATGSMNIKCYHVPYPTITYPTILTVIYLTSSCSLRTRIKLLNYDIRDACKIT